MVSDRYVCVWLKLIEITLRFYCCVHIAMAFRRYGTGLYCQESTLPLLHMRYARYCGFTAGNQFVSIGASDHAAGKTGRNIPGVGLLCSQDCNRPSDSTLASHIVQRDCLLAHRVPASRQQVLYVHFLHGAGLLDRNQPGYCWYAMRNRTKTFTSILFEGMLTIYVFVVSHLLLHLRGDEHGSFMLPL